MEYVAFKWCIILYIKVWYPLNILYKLVPVFLLLLLLVIRVFATRTNQKFMDKLGLCSRKNVYRSSWEQP